jgi:biopolymer transport protein ExbB/TolQ
MDFSVVTSFAGNSIYLLLASIALWGAFCVIVVWRRVAQTRFRSEEEQSEFLDRLDEELTSGDFDAATKMCDEDDRAMPQLALLALTNREMRFAKVRSLVTDRFQRDVLAELEYRLSWVYTVIKSAPMLGLLGTVLGMMGAFQKLTQGQNVEPAQLAEDISFALITTACGLSIAIPLILATASINVRIRKMEDLVGTGLTRFLSTFRAAVGGTSEERK